MIRNHEYYVDKTAYEAIKNIDRKKKYKPREWGNRLTYRISEVMKVYFRS